MTFGILTTRWQILRKDQQGKLETISKIIEACFRLHNFVIDQDQEFDGLSDDEIMSTIKNMDGQSRAFFDIVPLDNDGNLLQEYMNQPGVSVVRDVLRDYIVSKDLQRPQHNLERQRQFYTDIYTDCILIQ